MSDKPPPVFDVEVLPPEQTPPGGSSAGAGANRVPFHPLAATLLILVDNLWNFADWAVISWIVTIPLCFLTVFLPTFFIQRKKNGDLFGPAFLKALFLGVLAAVPTSITGTPVGLALLAWAGIKAGQK